MEKGKNNVELVFNILLLSVIYYFTSFIFKKIFLDFYSQHDVESLCSISKKWKYLISCNTDPISHRNVL